MTDPDFAGNQALLGKTRVAILGLGLMGASLALALRGQCAGLLGADPDPETLEIARSRGVVDRASRNPASLLAEADLIVLAAPVRPNLELLRSLHRLHTGSAVVIDLSSTKAEVYEAMRALPARFDPLGGHPMCGKERSGIVHAESGLYQGAPFVFTPLERTSQKARQLGAAMAHAVGAYPLWLDPATHDRWAAATSHLPYLLSVCLALATPLEAAPLVGPGFRSTTRLAASSPGMMLDVLSTNRPEILASLARLRAQIERVERQLAGEEDQRLQSTLVEAAARRQELEQAQQAGVGA
jgi:prephenate dehydrogenase